MATANPNSYVKVSDPKFKWPPYPLDSPKYFDPAISELYRSDGWAAPRDARFPEQNQTRHCFVYYVDYHRCINLKGEDYEPCKYLQKVYKDMCYPDWTDRWDSWIEEGRFPYNFDKYRMNK